MVKQAFHAFGMVWKSHWRGGDVARRGGACCLWGGDVAHGALFFNPSLNNSNVSGVHKIVHVLYLVKGEESGKNRVV